MLETNLDKLYKLLEGAYEDLDKMKDMISKLQLEARKIALKDVPGEEGVFDGKVLVTEGGEKLEVPANYAAKSRIVYGDRLKVYEEDGRQMFKQVEKVSRKKVPAVVSKKEGKFFALTEYGDHELSTVAVEFNKLEVNDKIQVILPEDSLKAPFATLDKLLDQKEASTEATDTSSKNSSEATAKKPEVENKEDEKNVEKEQVQKIDKEFVMDLTSKEDTKAAEAPESKKEISAPSVAAPGPTKKPSSAPRSASRSSSRSSSKSSSSSSAPSRSRGGSKSAPRSGDFSKNTAPTSSASETPFILDDDDLR